MFGYMRKSEHKEEVRKLKQQLSSYRTDVMHLRQQAIQLKSIADQFRDLATDAVHSQLNKDELKKIAILCHPDKHGGSKTAEKMFVKINGMRGN